MTGGPLVLTIIQVWNGGVAKSGRLGLMTSTLLIGILPSKPHRGLIILCKTWQWQWFAHSTSNSLSKISSCRKLMCHISLELTLGYDVPLHHLVAYLNDIPFNFFPSHTHSKKREGWKLRIALTFPRKQEFYEFYQATFRLPCVWWCYFHIPMNF